MKTSLCFWVLLIMNTISFAAGPRDAQWKKVDDAIKQGLPKTAIEVLDPIILEAYRDKALGEAAKAIAQKIVMEGNIQGNKAEEKITRMEAEIGKAPAELKPLLQAIQANWYWQYFQNNRWRFMQRTATAQAPNKDFTTWDLPRLFTEIDKVFSLSLSAPDALKVTSVQTFDDLLTKGTMPDSYRPTLYDFIAQEALKFYMSGEQAAAKPSDSFEFSADSPILGPASAFMAWKPETTDVQSPKLQAISLFQALLAFHKNDKDQTAFADADLARIQWGGNTAFGEGKAARHKAALNAFIERWSTHEISAVAISYVAQLIKAEGDWVEARKLAQRGASAFPNSPGGKLCQRVVVEIETKTLSITNERVWNKPLPTIAVHYRNITTLHFRVVAWDWNDFLDKKHARPEWLNDNDRKELLARKPALEWESKLPATTDFKEHTVELPAPDGLKPGFYFIVASHKPDFKDGDNVVYYSDFWVSDIALVVFTRQGAVEGFVLDAESGDPVPDAEIVGWYMDHNTGLRRTNGPPVQTDANGWFAMKSEAGRSFIVRARARGQELGSMQEYYAWNKQEINAQDRVLFFTDRAMYRPGQTIGYKGIIIRVDQEKDNYKLIPRRKVEVVFNDPNGKEIARQTQESSEYGSFSGSFTAPRDRVMGQCQILVANIGSTQFSVEEYKRPKFLATLDAPKTAPKLSDSVLVRGKAEAYTGAGVDDAPVKWRVVREVRWPYWWNWWSWRGGRGGRGSESQEIAHGTTRTGVDGSYEINFTAKPDPQVDEKSEASFYFHVYADITDSTGETRSAQRGVQVGFTALSARVFAPDWLTTDKPIEVSIFTTTLDGEPQTAQGTVKIYRLKEPAAVQRPKLSGGGWRGEVSGDSQPAPDLSDPNQWPLGDVVMEKTFVTDAKGKASFDADLGVGVYRAMLETQDRFGKKVTARTQLMVLEPKANRLAIKVPNLFRAPTWQCEPGSEIMALWGTGYAKGRAFIEVEHRDKRIQRYWTPAGETQHQIKQAVTEAMRGGFQVHITYVRENRAYFQSQHVDVPWSNQDLDLKWEHFTSKLLPNQKETWTAVVTRKADVKGRADEKVVAEMVAALFDASLDAYRHHDWLRKFDFFRQDYSQRSGDFANALKTFQHMYGNWSQGYPDPDIHYREFPRELIANFWGYQFMRMRREGTKGRMDMSMSDAMPMMAMSAPAAAPPMGAMSKNAVASDAVMEDGLLAFGAGEAKKEKQAQGGGGAGGSAAPDLSKVAARKNLNETAFFYPQLISDSNGVFKIQFTMPEALTQWRFIGFAHDRQLRSGYLGDKAVTAKDLMVQPNPPRFLREGDTLEFTVKVSNQSAERQRGKVRLTFANAENEQSADSLLSNTKPEQEFDIPSKESRGFSWRIKVPDATPFLTYKAVAASATVSDGEEGFVPVLSRRILVTKSLPLPIRGPGTKTFNFAKLGASGKSDTLRHQGLTVQMVSNPAWYAVLALPYLMEFPHECSEQTFNRLYANTLARFIAASDPKIHRVFEQWRGTPALDSPLEKNQDLKSVMIEETPWLRQAQAESKARRNVGILFEDNRLNNEIERTLQKLTEMQYQDGAWPWFPGGPGNDYITLYITTGMGRLRHLGTKLEMAPAIRSLNRLDGWIDERYRWILAHDNKDDNHLNETIALYLYGRSFFLNDKPIAPAHQEAVNYFLGQARTYWLKLANRQSQGHLAIGLKRFGVFNKTDDPIPMAIMKSIKERSVSNEELGLFWRETELSWWWYRAPIETQSLMIEAFDEVMGDMQAVEDCKVWLLKQKQTQDWKTTKATADAVYALLLRGREMLSSDALVQVEVGGINITPVRKAPDQKTVPAVEAGTGFFERRFTPAEIKPAMSKITLRKTDAGVAWGSMHWQYLEDMTKVTPYEGTPLKLKKSLYTKVTTKKGPVLELVKGAVAVGDELVTRIELRVDRDMEYIHLKDQRGSGVEPVNVISHYKYQDGLAYYESTRDTASHFFIDYLPKGVYVFEYSSRVQHRGQYQSGLAEIQCMYAPEFNSHSESFNLVVK